MMSKWEGRKSKLIIGFLALTVFVVGFFVRALTQNGERVALGSELTYYLTVNYDGIDKDGTESSDTQIISVKADNIIQVTDKLPDGLTFKDFEKITDGTFQAIRRDTAAAGTCAGYVIDDTNDPLYTVGTDTTNEYTYHGLHYNKQTSEITFRIKDLQAGCKLSIGIITTTPTSVDDPNTPEVEIRKDFYNTAQIKEGNVVVNSNTLHNYVFDETKDEDEEEQNGNLKSHSVKYEWEKAECAALGSLPLLAEHVEGSKVNIEQDKLDVDTYEFLGWETSDVVVMDGKFVIPNKDVTFIGKCKAISSDPNDPNNPNSPENPNSKKHYVTYEIVGNMPTGFKTPRRKIYEEGDIITVDSLASGYEQGGYRFLGWTTSDAVINGNNQFEMPNHNVLIKGEWQLITYTLDYAFSSSSPLPPNSAQLLPTSKTIAPGTVVVNNNLADQGLYIFNGWNTGEMFMMPAKNTTVTGSWSKIDGYFEPEITLELENQKPEYEAGELITYKVTIKNNETFDIEDIAIENLDSKVPFPDNPAYSVLTVKNDLIVIPKIAAGDTLTFTYDYQVKDTDRDRIINTIDLAGATMNGDYVLKASNYNRSLSANVKNPTNPVNPSGSINIIGFITVPNTGFFSFIREHAGVSSVISIVSIVALIIGAIIITRKGFKFQRLYLSSIIVVIALFGLTTLVVYADPVNPAAPSGNTQGGIVGASFNNSAKTFTAPVDQITYRDEKDNEFYTGTKSARWTDYNRAELEIELNTKQTSVGKIYDRVIFIFGWYSKYGRINEWRDVNGYEEFYINSFENIMAYSKTKYGTDKVSAYMLSARPGEIKTNILEFHEYGDDRIDNFGEEIPHIFKHALGQESSSENVLLLYYYDPRAHISKKNNYDDQVVLRNNFMQRYPNATMLLVGFPHYAWSWETAGYTSPCNWSDKCPTCRARLVGWVDDDPLTYLYEVLAPAWDMAVIPRADVNAIKSYMNAPTNSFSYEITDEITEYFEIATDGNISLVSGSGATQLVEENGKQKVVVTSDSLISGSSIKLRIPLKVKDAYKDADMFMPTNEYLDIDHQLKGRDKYNNYTEATPVLEHKKNVIYEMNTPSGCQVADITERHVVYDTVEIRSDVPNCDGYNFNGYEILTSGVKQITDDSFIMPDGEVVIRATWGKSSIVKDYVVNGYKITLKPGIGHWSDLTSVDATLDYLKNSTGTMVTSDIYEEPGSCAPYRFAGWYKDRTYTQKVETTEFDKLGFSATLFAKYNVVNQYVAGAGNFATNVAGLVGTNTTDVILADDPDSNPRYIGRCPNNYVSFNGELWRIIGVFDTVNSAGASAQRVKIVRADSIGRYSWDSSAAGTNYGGGVNTWSQADIQNLLNNGAYWNRTSGNCYNDVNNATVPCDFSGIGLTNDAKNMIEAVKWYTGAANTTPASSIDAHFSITTASHLYPNEKRESGWTGNVGLFAPSDYIYSLNGCKNGSGPQADRSTCTTTVYPTWMGVDSKNTWMPTSDVHLFNKSYQQNQYNTNCSIRPDGSVNMSTDATARDIYPTVYLKSDISIVGGLGTMTDPYIIQSL